MRKALIIGIDFYTHIKSLSGCVNDANAVKAALERNADGTVNFVTPRLITGTNQTDAVKKSDMKDAVRELFTGDSDIALLYFAGHGYVEDTGGFLCASDCRTGDDGFSLAELMTLASNSNAKNKVIILDSCHSGILANKPTNHGFAEINEGMTILTASTEEQYAMEVEGGGSGVFTSL